METKQSTFTASSDFSMAQRSRRHVPRPAPASNAQLVLLQVESRLQRLRSRLAGIQRTLETQLQTLRSLRDDAGGSETHRRYAERCIVRTQALMDSIHAQLRAAAVADGRRHALSERLAQGEPPVRAADLLVLENQLAASETALLGLTTNRRLMSQTAFIDAMARGAGPDLSPVQEPPSGASCAAAAPGNPALGQARSGSSGAGAEVDGAGLVAGRRDDLSPVAAANEPAVRVLWEPLTALARLHAEMDGLLPKVENYRAVLVSQLNSLNLALNHVRAYGSAAQVARAERQIEATQYAIDVSPALRDLVEPFVRRVSRALELQNQGDPSIDAAFVRQLEQEGKGDLIDSILGYYVNSPVDDNVNFLYEAAMLDASAGSGSDSGSGTNYSASGCGPSGASASQTAPFVPARRAMDVYEHATPESLVPYFRHGAWVNGNPHLRRYVFANDIQRSCIEIQACQFQLTTSADSNAAVAATFFAGLFAGLGVGGPVGAGLVGGLRANDAVSQGYIVRFLADETATAPEEVLHIYGWVRSPGMFSEVAVGGVADPRRMPNMSDRPDGVVWYSWHFGAAYPRTWTWPDAYQLPPLPGMASAQNMCQTVSQLVQRMAEWSPPPAMGADASGRHATRQGEPTPLLTVVH